METKFIHEKLNSLAILFLNDIDSEHYYDYNDTPIVRFALKVMRNLYLTKKSIVNWMSNGNPTQRVECTV